MIVVAQVWLLHPPRQFAVPVDPFRPLPSLAAVRRDLPPGQRMAAIGRNVRPQLPSALAIPDPRAEDALYPERYARLVALRGGGARFGFLDALTAADGRRSTWSTRPASATWRRRPARRPRPACGRCRRGTTTWRCSRTPRPTRTRSRPRAVEFAGSEDAAARALGSDGTAARPLGRRAADGRDAGRHRHRHGDRRASRAGITSACASRVAARRCSWSPRRRSRAGRRRSTAGRRRSGRPTWRCAPWRCPDGTHELEFRYRPASFRLGILLGIAGILALLARILVPRLRQRRPTA